MRRALQFTLFMIVAATLATGLATAAGDEEIGFDPLAKTTVLQPGHNYVGWVAAPMSVDSLLGQFPQITEVRAWDALRQGSYTPTELTPGQGVRITVESDSPVLWRRSMKPVKGLVILRAGRNLVTWMGVDRTPLDRALLGVGSPLQTASVWSPRSQTHKMYDATSLGDGTALPRLSRGDSIWVTASRTVNWLQPTGRLPVVKFPGGTTDKLRLQVMADMSDTIEMYRDVFGIEADFATYIVYAATDVEALIDVYRRDVPDHYDVSSDFGRLRSRWDTAAGWINDDRIVVKQRHWRDSNQATASASGEVIWAGRAILTHEYTHIVQAQLSTANGFLKAFDGYKYARAPQWLVEGSATWVEDVQKVNDGTATWSDAVASVVATIADAPSLRFAIGNIAYNLGSAASHFVRQRVGLLAVIDSFRLMNANEAGPDSRWLLTPSWEDAFEMAVGMSIDQFHTDFEYWRGSVGAHGPAGNAELVGQLVNKETMGGKDGQVLDFRDVRLELYGTSNPGATAPEWADSEGRFVFRDVPDGSYTLRTYFGECFLYSDIEVGGDDDRSIQVAIGRDTCAHQIQGQIVGGQGVTVAGWRLSVAIAGGYSTTISREDGRFAVTVPQQGSYFLRLDVGPCQIEYARAGGSGLWDREMIDVEGFDVTGIRFALPQDLCIHRLAGRLLNADGTPRANVLVNANGSVGSGSAWTSPDGAFSFAVPSSGSYRLSAWVDGCSIYRGSRGPTKSWNSASQIQVSNADVAGIEFRLPEDPSSLCSR